MFVASWFVHIDQCAVVSGWNNIYSVKYKHKVILKKQNELVKNSTKNAAGRVGGQPQSQCSCRDDQNRQPSNSYTQKDEFIFEGGAAKMPAGNSCSRYAISWR